MRAAGSVHTGRHCDVPGAHKKPLGSSVKEPPGSFCFIIAFGRGTLTSGILFAQIAAVQKGGDLRSCAGAIGIKLAAADTSGNTVLYCPGGRFGVVAVAGTSVRAVPVMSGLPTACHSMVTICARVMVPFGSFVSR